jgi:hypothetical protein
MEFRIGKISAKCSCGSTQFKADPEDLSGPLARFYCARCGTGMLYSELIAQIGKQGAPRSNEGRAARPKRSYSRGGTVRK